MRLSLPAALSLLTLAAPPALGQQLPLRIGLSAPLTGPDSGFGQGMRLGAEQAVADINRAGGVSGRKLALVVADDAGDGRQGVAVAKKFAADRIGFVVGPLNSIVAAVATPVYEEAGIVVVTPGAIWGPLTGRGWWNLFRLGASDAQQAVAAADYLAERYAGRRIGIVHDRTTFGRGLADAISRALKAKGSGEAVFVGLAKGSKDAGDVVGPLQDAQIAAVYFGGLAPEGALLAKGMREAGLDAALVGSDGLLDKDFPLIAGPAAEGTLMTLPAEARKLPDAKVSESKVSESRVSDGKAKPALRPPEADAFAGQTYAAVEVLARGVERAKSTDGRKVAAALHDGTPLHLSAGEIAFDAKGDPARPEILMRVWRRTPDGRIDYAGNEPGP